MTDTASAASAATSTSDTSTDNGLAPQADPATLAALADHGAENDSETGTTNASDDATDGGDETNESETQGELVKLTVNGKEISKPMGDVVKLAQQAIAAGNIMQRVKEQRDALAVDQRKIEGAQNGIKQLLGLFQRGDFDTIADFVHTKLNAGQTFDQSVIKYALRLYEESKMSPEDRDRHNAVRERDKLKRELEARSKAEQDAKNEYEVNRAQEHIVQEVPKALKAVGLPDTNFVREQLLSIWRNALDRGQAPTAQAVAAHLKKRLAEAGMLKDGQVTTQPAANKRPRATAASVGMKTEDAPQYVSMTEWQKTRGKR